jgi:hypothetical protein
VVGGGRPVRILDPDRRTLLDPPRSRHGHTHAACEPDVFLDARPVIDNPAHGPGGSRIERIDLLMLRRVEAIEFHPAGRRPPAWPGLLRPRPDLPRQDG